MELGERRLEDHAGEEAGVAAAGAHGDEAAHRVTVQEAGEAAKFGTYLQTQNISSCYLCDISNNLEYKCTPLLHYKIFETFQILTKIHQSS